MSKQKEHPILFSGEMVRAILESRKTQTRRVCNKEDQELFDCLGVDGAGVREVKCRYGVPGDRLWVRETWGTRFYQDEVKPSELDPKETRIYYAAQDHLGNANIDKWRPSIHMPRWASRITLEITNIRVERVQDISEEDAPAEGVEAIVSTKGCSTETYLQNKDYITAFKLLWDSINAKRGYGWNENPWVWVIEFKTFKPEI